MPRAVTNTETERYINAYQDALGFTDRHKRYAKIALVAGAAIGLLTYGLLAHLIPNSMTLSGKLMASIAAGSVVAIVAVFSVLFHYALNVSRSDRILGAEMLFTLLADEVTNHTTAKNGGHYLPRLLDHFISSTLTDTHRQDLFEYFLKNLNFLNEVKTEVFKFLLAKSTHETIVNFVEYESEGNIDITEYSDYESQVDDKLDEMDAAGWAQLMQLVSARYFEQPQGVLPGTPTKLLFKLYQLDGAKFHQALTLCQAQLEAGLRTVVQTHMPPAAAPPP